ncbi:MAG TPA: hypothetical protein VGB41_04595 [Acidimicrobiia bacterium]
MGFRKMAGWAGVMFVVLNVVAFFIWGTPPDADAPASEVAKYLADGGNTYKFGIGLSGIAVIFAVPFIAGFLIPFFRSDREHGEGYGVVVLGGFLVSGALYVVAVAVNAALALRGGFELDAATTRALWDLQYTAYALAILAVPIFAGGAARAIGKRGVMPAWFGYLSWVVALLGFTGIAGTVSGSGIGMLALAGYVGLLLWVLVAGIVLLRDRAAAA